MADENLELNETDVTTAFTTDNLVVDDEAIAPMNTEEEEAMNLMPKNPDTQTQETKDEEEKVDNDGDGDGHRDDGGQRTGIVVDEYKGDKEEEKYPIEDKDSAPGNRLLQRLFDSEQGIPSCAHSKSGGGLNDPDPEWRYNIRMGDLELREIEHIDGTKETLWFPMEKYPKGYDPFPPSAKAKDEKKDKKESKDKKKVKIPLPPRKVFVALKVKRVSSIDNIAETFRMRFHIYFNWLPTVSDYKSYYAAKKEAKETNDPTVLMKWKPKWYPHLEFQNMIESHTCEWEEYPEEGNFRIQSFKDFALKKGEKAKDGQFDPTKAKFLRAKLECEMTFAEELELQSFPFDCQDLSCIIHERTTSDVRCIFLPELRKPGFASIDPRYSVIDEWDLETAILEFGDADANSSRSKTSYAMIVLRLKMKRRWKVFIANIVFLMACISLLALTAFSLTVDDLGDRLNLLITLILTAVAFSYVVFESLPNVPYLTYMDKYILGSYGFFVTLMIESSFLGQEWMTDDIDLGVFYFAVAWLICYNIGFGIYGWYLRKEEGAKLFYDSDQVEEEVNLSRPGLRFDYTKRLRSGKGGRLLSFVGYTHASDSMDDKQKAAILKKQEQMDRLLESANTLHGYDASEVPESPKMDSVKK